MKSFFIALFFALAASFSYGQDILFSANEKIVIQSVSSFQGETPNRFVIEKTVPATVFTHDGSVHYCTVVMESAHAVMVESYYSSPFEVRSITAAMVFTEDGETEYLDKPMTILLSQVKKIIIHD